MSVFYFQSVMWKSNDMVFVSNWVLDFTLTYFSPLHSVFAVLFTVLSNTPAGLIIVTAQGVFHQLLKGFSAFFFFFIFFCGGLGESFYLSLSKLLLMPNCLSATSYFKKIWILKIFYTFTRTFCSFFKL